MKSQIARTMTGLLIVAVGVGFLLDSAHVINFGTIASTWWPLAVIVAGIIMLINDSRNYLWSFLIIGLGVFFQLKEFYFIDINPWELFWPLVVIIVGASLIFRPGSGHKVAKTDRDDLSAIMGGVDQKNVSEDFKGSKLTAVMGGVKLDLRKAKIKKEATIDVFAFWGGIELIVPRNIVVRNKASSILGSVENTAEQDEAKDVPVLYITGDAIMGSVEIKN